VNSRFPWRIVPEPGPGKIDRGHIVWDSTRLRGLSLPCFAIQGERPGPAVAIIAAIHGGEYPGPAGAIEFARQLDPGRVSGSILVLPLVNLSSFRERSAFITPEDGENLNRQFPGRATGTFTEVLAHHLIQDVIEPADILIDLHSGDVFESLSDHTGYYEMPDPAITQASRAIAAGFAAPMLLRLPAPSSNGSMTAAAASIGKMVAFTEIGGNGLLLKSNVITVRDGLDNALRIAGVLDGHPAPAHPVLHEPAGSVSARNFGLWWPDITLLQPVAADEPLGVITDFFGEVLEEVRSPNDGLVRYYLTSLAAREGDTLVSLVRPVDQELMG
jgi:uncharacterized protein